MGSGGEGERSDFVQQYLITDGTYAASIVYTKHYSLFKISIGDAYVPHCTIYKSGTETDMHMYIILYDSIFVQVTMPVLCSICYSLFSFLQH